MAVRYPERSQRTARTCYSPNHPNSIILTGALRLCFCDPYTLSSRPERHAFVSVTRSGETPVLALALASALVFAFAFLVVISQGPASVFAVVCSFGGSRGL